MSDSISLSSEALRRVDELCDKCDPAKRTAFQGYLARIPDPVERQYVVDFVRTDVRAHAEISMILTSLIDYAKNRSIQYPLVLHEFSESNLFGATIESRLHELQDENAEYERYRSATDHFDKDADLGDGFGEQGHNSNWGVIQFINQKGSGGSRRRSLFAVLSAATVKGLLSVLTRRGG